MSVNLQVAESAKSPSASGGRMFNAGDYVVCPGHGVGQVLNTDEKELGGQKLSFYCIKIISNDMKVMVPTSSQDGVRSLVNDQKIEEVFGLLNNHDVKVDNSTWNRRHREYLHKIKTGSILEIADVLRSLFLLKHTKTLSFGEKKMLEQCKQLLVEEIALAQGQQVDHVSTEIDSCFVS